MFEFLHSILPDELVILCKQMFASILTLFRNGAGIAEVLDHVYLEHMISLKGDRQAMSRTFCDEVLAFVRRGLYIVFWF